MYVIPQPRIADRGHASRFGGRDRRARPARTARRRTSGARGTRTAGAGRTPPTCRRSPATPAAGDWLDSISIIGAALRAARSGPTHVGRRPPARRAVQRHEPGAGAALEGQQLGLTSYRVTRAPAHAPRRARGRRRPRGARSACVYDDPDGERLRCWNSEVADLRCQSGTARAAGSAAGMLRETLRRAAARLLRVRPARPDRRAADAHRRMTPRSRAARAVRLARRADRGRRCPAATRCSRRASPALAARRSTCSAGPSRRPAARRSPPRSGSRRRGSRRATRCTRRACARSRSEADLQAPPSDYDGRSRRCRTSPASCASPTACRSR